MKSASLVRVSTLLGMTLLVTCVQSRVAMALPSVLAGPIRDNVTSDQSWYYLLSPSSWTDAEAKARQMGGHLLIPSTPQENFWVWNTLRHSADPATVDGLWIGYRQASPSGPCGSADGAFTLINGGNFNNFPGAPTWAPGQPDNGASLGTCAPENWVMMDAAFGGKWNDVVNDPPGKLVYGVVEVVTFNAGSTINFNAYSGDVEPTTDGDMFNAHGEAWANLNLMEGSKIGSVVSDPDAKDGLAYRINDTNTNNTAAGGTEKWVVRGGPTGDLTTILSGFNNAGVTVVARVKVPSWSDNGAGGSNLFIDDYRNDNKQATHIRWDGQTPLLRETLRGLNGSLPIGAGDGQYHVIRWTTGKTANGAGTPDATSLTINVYFDENPTPVLTIGPGLSGLDGGDPAWYFAPYSATSPFGTQVRDGVGFGTNAQNGTEDFYLDYFAFILSKEDWNAATGGLSAAIPPGIDHAFNDLVKELDNLHSTRCGLTITTPQFNYNVGSVAHCATNSMDFVLTNYTPSSLNYTIEEVRVNMSDGSVTVGNLSWVTLSKSSGTIAAGGTDTVTVSVKADGVQGLNIVGLRFNTDCPFAPRQVREIRFTDPAWGPPCSVICHAPFADADGDGDVDMDDFAMFQSRYTGGAVQINGFDLVARCFDHNNDNHIDGTDLTAFTQCATRAGVPANPACNP